jgi:hypothetical protein
MTLASFRVIGRAVDFTNLCVLSESRYNNVEYFSLFLTIGLQKLDNFEYGFNEYVRGVFGANAKS